MHPEVVEARDVPCRICLMKLVPRHGGGAFLCALHAGEGLPGAIDIAPAKCRECGEDLQPARTETVWDCPRHRQIGLPSAEPCFLCGREPVPRTLAVLWSCAEHPEAASPEEGKCSRCGRGFARILLDLPHGDHNPKHGGQLFMAADNWHHLEGTLPAAGLFRLHLYDNFTRPLVDDGVEGHLRRGRYDEASGEVELEPESIPLSAVAGTSTFEASLGEHRLPLDLVLFITFGAKGKRESVEPERFDFTFRRLSTPPAAGDAPSEEPLVQAVEVPSSPDGILRALEERSRRVAELLAEGALERLYVPALEARDLALALSERLEAGLPAGARGAVARGALKVVRGAWLLDHHGDLGNREKAAESFGVFRRGVEEMRAGVPEAPETGPEAPEAPK
jgi:hypothetical protein